MMRWRKSLIAVAIALFAVADLCQSAVLTVSQDGSGDFATVWEALEVVQNGDQIWVGPGYYGESTDDGEVRAVTRWATSFTIRGRASNPDATTIAHLRMYLSGDIVVEDLTFADSCSPLTLQDWEVPGFNLQVRNCVFRNNGLNGCSTAGAGIEAVVAEHGSSTVLVEGCLFEENDTFDPVGGAISCHADLTIRDSAFIGNSCGGVSASNLIIDGCVFWNNVGNAVKVAGEHDIRNSTFWHNEAQSAIYTIAGPPNQSKIRNCIIGNTIGGYGVECAGWVEVTCSLLSFNDRGNWGYCEPLSDSGVVYDVDPLFCDEDTGDFMLRPDSPCLGGFLGGRECDLIGAYPMGCGVSPTVETSWGQLKQKFR